MMLRRQLVAFIGTTALLASGASIGCSSNPSAHGNHSDGAVTARTVSARGTAGTSSLTDAQKAALEPLQASAATFEENKGLSPDQVVARYQRLDETYAIGQAFASPDVEFIRIYSQPNESQLGKASRNFNNAKTSGGMTGRIQGNLNNNGSGPITQKYSVSVKMTSSAKVSKTEIRAEIRSYGVVGSGGVGLTYSATPKVSTSAHSYDFNRSGTYTSVAVYDTIIAYADFHGSGGSFNVQS